MTITADELNEICRLHKIWLESNCKKGKRAYFKGLDLSGADFRCKDLSCAEFFECKLLKTQFNAATLKKCRFSMCNFDNTQLDSADMRECLFVDVTGYSCSFSSTVLKNAAFVRAHLLASQFAFADLSGCKIDDCTLTCSNFNRTVLNDVNTVSVDFDGSSFVQVSTQKAVFVYTNFTSCSFIATNLATGQFGVGCAFTGATGVPVHQITVTINERAETITLFMPSADEGTWQFISELAIGSKEDFEKAIDEKFKLGTATNSAYKRAGRILFLFAEAIPFYAE